MDHIALRRALRGLAPFAFLLPFASAQGGCPGFGSLPMPATITASPVPLGCTAAPNAPQWHLLTPGHRQPAPHAGFTPGNAHALPQLLVRYRCTGLLLVPVLPIGIRTMGYVLDQPEYPCAIRT
jgi:hypothetical protein